MNSKEYKKDTPVVGSLLAWIITAVTSRVSEYPKQGVPKEFEVPGNKGKAIPTRIVEDARYARI